jgi:hypothetical protein
VFSDLQVQFVGIAVHSFQLLFIECNYPKAFVWWIGCHGLLFLVLFSNFYRREYLLKRKLANEKKRIALNATVMQEKKNVVDVDDSNVIDNKTQPTLLLRRSNRPMTTSLTANEKEI